VGGRRSVTAVAIVLGLVLAAASTSAQAQVAPPRGCRPLRRRRYHTVVTPAPTPFPMPSDVNSEMSAGSAIVNLGSNFLERLGQQASYGFGSGLRRNPGGGGARSDRRAGFSNVGETYGISLRTAPKAISPVIGVKPGVALWVRRTCRAGVNVGISVDKAIPPSTFHSRCSPRGSILPVRSERLDRQGAVDMGDRAGPRFRDHQFGAGHRRRLRRRRLRRPSRRRLTELSYYWSLDQSRIVPRPLSNMCAPRPIIPGNGRSGPVAATGATQERSGS